MTWLADASVLLAAQDPTDEEQPAAAALLTGDTPMATLDLAYYEGCNVAVRAWRAPEVVAVICDLVDALAEDGRVVRVDHELAARASVIAEREGISVYDAAYVAGAERIGARLVSCDIRDLVSRGLAVTPAQAVAEASPPPSGPPPA